MNTRDYRRSKATVIGAVIAAGVLAVACAVFMILIFKEVNNAMNEPKQQAVQVEPQPEVVQRIQADAPAVEQPVAPVAEPVADAPLAQQPTPAQVEQSTQDAIDAQLAAAGIPENDRSLVRQLLFPNGVLDLSNVASESRLRYMEPTVRLTALNHHVYASYGGWAGASERAAQGKW